jgi:hypothetical protein
VVENNRLVNVADADRLANPRAQRVVGPLQPLKFSCGVEGEFTVDGWSVRRTPR